MKTSLFIGRYQPFHDGHKALIDKVLKEGNDVVIAIRDTHVDKSNPYTVKERIKLIEKIYPDAFIWPHKGIVTIMSIPDITEVVYGRKVGWGVREIKLDKDTESISATKIRNNTLTKEEKEIIEERLGELGYL